MSNEEFSNKFYEKLALYLLESSAPLSTVDNPTFQSIFSAIGIELLSSYKMEKHIERAEKKFRGELINHLSLYPYVSLILDEWKNIHDQSIIMFNIAAPNNEVFYWRQVNTKFDSLTSEECAKQIHKILKELNSIGIHVSCIMTDNCPTMRAISKTETFAKDEKKFGAMLTVGCGCHIFNIVCKKWVASNIFSETYQWV